MGIDIATWRARIGLNCYNMCRPLRTRWGSSGVWLYQPGVASWGVGEVMNDTPLVLKGCLTVVALSLILQYAVHSWSKLKGRGGGGKVCCHWQGSTFQAKGKGVKRILDGGRTLLLRAYVVVLPLLLVRAGDVELNPGPEEPRLLDLLEELYPVCTNWYNIGLHLQIPYTTLDRFKQMYKDPLELMREMLKHWLDTAINPHPSWEAVVRALRSPTVNNKKVAEELELKYCAPVHHVREKSNSSNTTPPLSKKSQKLPFGCGCYKCTFFSFIESGCPTPIPSVSSFPYLDLSGLTHEQQQELSGKLWSESQNIMIRFQELVSATIKSFKRRCVPLDELVSHVMTLGAFDPVFKESQVPVFRLCFNELKAADTIPKVFMILNDYFSFFNYYIIEHVIKELGTKKDKDRLKKYIEDFNQYAKRRIFECPPEFGPVSDADHADIFVKLDSQYDNYSVIQIEGFRRKLSEILYVSSQGILRLCRVDKGCFQLMFQMPSFLQQEIFPLSKQQKRALADVGVIKLTCGECQFLKDELSQEGVEKKHQDDPDGDSGMGTSIFTDTKSTIFSEDRLDKELKELDYELRVQGLIETASSHESWSGLKLHIKVAMGQLENVKFLVEKQHCKPMQKDPNGITPFHVAAVKGILEVFKYFVTECNCNPACPGPLGLTPLHLASEGGHLDMVKYLLIEQQMEPLCEDEYGHTPLHRASAGGCQAVVEFLTSELQRYAPIPKLVSDLKNKWNSTPLHLAAAKGHLDILRFFISGQNCDPNIPGQFGVTLLHAAAEFGHLHIVKYLIDEQGCNLDKDTTIHFAAEFGHLHIVKYLIDERGCDPSCLDEHKYTPLHCATMKGQIDIVKFLTIEKHCDPLCKDLNLNTPLHMAVVRGHKEIVKFLIVEMHCSPTSRNVNNAAAVHLAAMNGHLDILKFLISEQKCDLNLPGQNGVTPLHCAAQYGQQHIVKYLIDEQHCNPSCLDEDEYTPLHCAAQEGHMNVVMFLTMEKRCNPRSRNVNKDTALHLAAVNGNLDIIQFFISDQNCNPNIPGGKHGATPLHYAAENGHLNIVKYLIDEQGCDPSCLDKGKYTPLHCAAMQGHLDIAKFLTEERHCDPNIPGQYDKTALHYAAESGHLHIVKYLTDEQGCNPSCWDKDRDTPLHYATKEGHIDVVKFLAVERHCNPMCKSLNLNTPLHYAVMSGHLEIVKFFTEELKCPPDITGACNMTTLQMAVLNNHPDVAQYLQKHSVIPYIITATSMMKQLGLLK